MTLPPLSAGMRYNDRLPDFKKPDNKPPLSMTIHLPMYPADYRKLAIAAKARGKKVRPLMREILRQWLDTYAAGDF